MLGKNDWHCWEIMGCDESENCQAKQHPETPCWELANEAGDYRNFFSICHDCIVFIIKTNVAVFSEKEKKFLMQK